MAEYSSRNISWIVQNIPEVLVERFECPKFTRSGVATAFHAEREVASETNIAPRLKITKS